MCTMKKMLCLVLVVLILFVATSCAANSATEKVVLPETSSAVAVAETETESKTETTTVVKTTTDPNRDKDFPAFTDDELTLLFRYFYITSWITTCLNASNIGNQNGYGDNYLPNTMPDKQYYKETETSKPILWSDQLEILAVKGCNESIAFYNYLATNGGYKLTAENKATLKTILDGNEKKASDSGISKEKMLTDWYGDGFTFAFLEKVMKLYVIQNAYSMPSYTNSSGSYDSDKLEQSMAEYQRLIDVLVTGSREKLKVNDAHCSAGKAASLKCIKDRIANGMVETMDN